MGRRAARRRAMLLAAPARSGDGGVVEAAAAGGALRATDADGTRTPTPVARPEPPTTPLLQKRSENLQLNLALLILRVGRTEI